MPSYSNNYSKWDALEVSDDSDIEGHPNVDHKSLVMWKQRDIHEKREARKLRIAEYEATLATNAVLLPRLERISSDLSKGGVQFFSQLIMTLRDHPSPDAPKASPNVMYDGMIYSLLSKVFDEATQEDKVDKDDHPKLAEALARRFGDHVKKLKEVTKDAKTALDEELAEQKKNITSDDIRDGFDSKYIPGPKEKPIEPAIKPKAKAKSTETTIETLNAPSSSSTTASTPSAPAAAPTKADAAAIFDDSDSDADDDEEIPNMTPSLTKFAQIPVNSRNYEASYAFLQNDKGIFTEGAVDAMLLEAFNAEIKGKRTYARQCVHQGLMIQYCEKLGRDGIGMFFKKMINGNKQAIDVFEQDVEQTYQLVKKRAAINKAEQEKIAEQGGVETIQLVAENPSTVISFDVPDGPPPADLRLEPSPETEGLDIEEVRQVLQQRWEIFEAFDPKLKKALQSNKLENVNKVLGKMSVEEAEQVVELLQVAQILQFAEGGIRDETGKGKEVEASEDD